MSSDGARTPTTGDQPERGEGGGAPIPRGGCHAPRQAWDSWRELLDQDSLWLDSSGTWCWLWELSLSKLNAAKELLENRALALFVAEQVSSVLNGEVCWITHWGVVEFKPADPEEWIRARPLYRALLEEIEEKKRKGAS